MTTAHTDEDVIAAADPAAVDTRLAELHHALEQARQSYAAAAERARHLVGERKVYRGRSRVWQTTNADAIDNLKAAMYARTIQPWDVTNAGAALEKATTATDEQATLAARIKPLNDLYAARRWSRFFTVPGGHIHSGTACAGGTIRPSTQVVWNPALSGQTEAEAVAALGPHLCSHCFRSAPVEWQCDPKGKAADPDDCTDLDLTDAQRAAINPRRLSSYVRCSCTADVSVTSTGRKRRHKRGDRAGRK